MTPIAAGALVFLTSGCVLTLEILAGRLLAPYVGVTLETYTGIIGTVLAGISAGTWAGGRMADRIEPRRMLGPLVVGGGALSLLIVPLVRFFGDRLDGRDPLVIIALAVAGFFLPAAVLSAVHPTVVKLQLRDLAVTGTVVGRLSALSTAGAIFGTFATGFVFVATLPTRAVIFVVGSVLVVLGAVVWLRLGGLGAAAPGLAALVVLGAGLAAVVGGPCPRPTVYYCADVVTDPARPTARTLVLDSERHSYVDLEDPTYLGFRYARLFGEVIDSFRPAGAPITALHIGGGGFTMPRYIAATRPGSESLVLEVDREVVALAEQELGLRRGPSLRVEVGDARLGLAHQPSGTYDLVVGDAFGGLAVPWHLTTREFTDDIRRVLKHDGVYVLNLIDYPPLRFARAEAATLRAVFQHVALLVLPQQLARLQGGNFVLVASASPLGIDSGRGGEMVAAGADYDAFAGTRVLTDDNAPVDQLITTR